MTTNDFEIIDNVLTKYNGSSDLVVIPDGVTTIGDHAFSNCSNITSINIADSVTSIGKYAFFKCSNLTSINIPDSVKTIGKYAFSECQGLKDENGFVIIRDILFGYYGDDEDVTIPQGTKSISRKAFYESIYLNSVNIPDSVTSIGEEAFEGCSNLRSINIPDTITSIEKYAFKGCKSLKDKNGFVIVHNILFDYFNEDKDILYQMVLIQFVKVHSLVVIV